VRLHALTVTAFGPFPGTEHVDFDALNDAGLFLLSGATGAGKTSILDAVCFALYGQVPGVRGIKTLKSQHAPDDARPEVVLDFSVRERRFVVRRTPEWTRPKRRGDGTTTEKARATIVEVRPDGEHLLSHRAAEVGQLVSDLVGMQASQFQQVAMLPQGEFQRFLHASSQDRHDVLQRLFHTDRFARIEEWVADHSRERRAAASAGQSTVQRLVDTLAEHARVPVPERLGPDGLVAASGSGETLAWARELLEDATARHEDSRVAHEQATRAEAEAARALDEARRAEQLRSRRAEAQAALAALSEASGAVEEAATALDAHRRASRVLPALAVLDRATREADTAAARAKGAATAASERGLSPTPTWTDTVALLRDQVARAERLVPLLAEHADAVTTLETTRRNLAGASANREAAVRERAALPARRDELRARLDEARERAGRVEALRLQVTASRHRARAADALPAAEVEADRLADQVRDARDHAADVREHMQDLLQRRLDGIAAELAGRLEDGAPCAVCGSTDHPSPAASDHAAVTDDEQAAAGAAFDEAQRVHADLAAREADARRQVASLREQAADRSAADWADEVARLQADLAAAEAATALATTLQTELADVERRLAAADDALRSAELRAAELTENVRAGEQRVGRAARALADASTDLLPGEGTDGVPALLARLDADLAAAELACDTTEAAASATERVTEVRAHALEAAAEEGFETLDDVRATLLTEAVQHRHEALLADHARRDAAARATLDDPALADLPDGPPADVDALAETAREARETLAAATRELHVAEQRLTAVRSLVDRLDAALTDWAPAREDYELAESMSRLVRGLGGDNQLQMRLSAYVLATRLDQVLDAANERLSHLRDQRYLLQRTDRAARRGSQAGLGLEVVDQWTGDVRDPATLSGGETFVVSLSLALGLADVVTHEAGGVEMETLFVDEGFGALDADTLDDVMDRLDGLRAGGRTVGIVSHVSELRSRVPVQLHVHKTPAGSSIRMPALVG
jgi:exonuclease SbcC